MPFQVEEAKYEDMEDMMRVLFETYVDIPFADMVCPEVARNSDMDKEQGILEAAERFITGWKATPGEHWLKVIDTDTGRMTSMSKWNIYDTNPFEDGPPTVVATWFPEGSREREYATWVLEQRLARESRRIHDPHVWLDICGTLPEYQRKGLASKMMEWGIQQADKRNLNSYIECSEAGRGLYEKFGYIYTGIFQVKKPDNQVDDEWKKLQNKWLLEYRWMWRPKQGKYNGEDYPWGDSND